MYITHTPLQVVTDVQSLKVPLPLTAALVLLPHFQAMLNGEDEGVLGCVVGVLPCVYCGLVSPHRSVGGDQVTVIACNDSNKMSRGSPTSSRKVTHIQLHNT